MNEKIKNLIFSYWKPIFFIVVIVLAFYWFQFRPSTIRQKCHDVASEKAKSLLKTKAELDSYKYRELAEKDMFLENDYQASYEMCLHQKGLK